MANIFTKEKVLFGLLLVIVVLLAQVIFGELALAAWPAFMVMIFFLMDHPSGKNALAVLAGGLFGILCLMFLVYLMKVIGPSIGIEVTQLLFVALFVYSIVLLKDAIPYLFNNYAFMYFLVSSVAAGTPGASPTQWIGVELIGGGLFIVLIFGIFKVIMALAAKGAAPPPEGPPQS